MIKPTLEFTCFFKNLLLFRTQERSQAAALTCSFLSCSFPRPTVLPLAPLLSDMFGLVVCDTPSLPSMWYNLEFSPPPKDQQCIPWITCCLRTRKMILVYCVKTICVYIQEKSKQPKVHWEHLNWTWLILVIHFSNTFGLILCDTPSLPS